MRNSLATSSSALSDTAKCAEVLPMTLDDLEAVHSVAVAAFANPWTREVIADELSRPWAFLHVLRPEPSADVIGFVSFWLIRDEVHVLNLAVHPEHHRRGFGRLLMLHVLAFARRRAARYVTLEVRISNSAARKLYEGLGFGGIGVRPGYYTDNAEDAVVMLRCF